MKLYGKNPVIERLKSNPKTIRKIYIQQGHSDGAYVQKKARKWSIPVYVVPQSKILKMGRSINTQGIVTEVDDFEYMDYLESLSSARQKGYSVFFLDSLNDPQNLGVIIRSLACLGKFFVVIPKHGSVRVTEAVLRIASGADNFIQICQVNNLANAIRKAKEEGFWIAGAVTTGGQDLRTVDLPFPLGLVIGSEQKGIREGLINKMDLKLTLPMVHQRLAFNAAQAATIFAYEITKQKNKQKKG